jgi:hypothetical protein
LVRRRPPARLPGVTLLSGLTTSRSGENGDLQIRREREEREIENGRERTTREEKRNLLQGSRVILCRKHMICVSLLDARDWSEKRSADQSIFSSIRLRQPLEKLLFFVVAA